MFLRLQMEQKGSTSFIYMACVFTESGSVTACNLVYFHQFSRLLSRNLGGSRFSSPASCGFCKEANSRAAASGRVSSRTFGLRLSGGGRPERSFFRLWSEMKRRPSARQGCGAQRPPGPGPPGLNRSRPARTAPAGQSGDWRPLLGTRAGCGAPGAGRAPRGGAGLGRRAGRRVPRAPPDAEGGLWSGGRGPRRCEVSQATPGLSLVARASDPP